MDDDAARWNARYEGREADEPTRPIGLDALSVPAGGLCLDVACGLGAQSVWAALNGFDVIALDVSPVAVEATKRFARLHDVGHLVDARVHDLERGLPNDVAGECTLVICQKFRDPKLYPQLVRALTTDGVLVVTELSQVGLTGDAGPFHARPGALVLAFRELDLDIVSHTEGHGVAGWADDLPTYEMGTKVATRKAIQAAFDATLPKLPGLIAGSADLTGNTGTKLAGQSPQGADSPGGRQIHFGVREHGMGSAMVGMAHHGGVIPVGGTFFVFLDYMRPPVRLAALSKAKVGFIFTHDSVGVGEDGPTHQPVEHLATLRAIPGLHVIRPADANETSAAWRDAVEHDGPTVLVLSRQDIPVVTDGSAVKLGAGVVAGGSDIDEPDVVLVGTGSEVAVCVAAAQSLAGSGVAARVVSMPSWDRFELQPAEFRTTIFPHDVPVLAVEAGVPMGWHRYADDVVSIDRFGASAPGELVLEELGINPTNVAERATALVKRRSS